MLCFRKGGREVMKWKHFNITGVRNSLSEKATFEQRPKGNERREANIMGNGEFWTKTDSWAGAPVCSQNREAEQQSWERKTDRRGGRSRCHSENVIFLPGVGWESIGRFWIEMWYNLNLVFKRRYYVEIRLEVERVESGQAVSRLTQ